MSLEIAEQPPAPAGRGQDAATAAPMSRYELARCRSVRDLLWSYGGIQGAPAVNCATEDTAVLSKTNSASIGVRVGERVRSLVRFVGAACRWVYERVAL